ncbi:hypothetical protein TrVE_jg11258 [Triparma verrucosa]|uniref:Phosphoglycerate mutase-like protein n=2 Tax=Triparma TaxID=722752 RepID=A0A9W7C7U4_9STRA|nr:hypothetical protein TrST_g11725 [Triparma strigata]GMI14379.1 hypothetical protein TrVE_jg11258 [Triparma verrucosa]
MDQDNFQFALGPPDSGFSLFLSSRCKKIHFIRHAEGHHNVATVVAGTNDCLKASGPPGDHPLYDARLTQKGIDQAKSLREHLKARPSQGRSFTHFDLVVVSPLTRTLETARHIFHRGRLPGQPPFLVSQCTKIDSVSGQEFNLPPPKVLVREECRERWGEYVCDGRRTISEIYPEFSDFDFSEVLHDEDVYYTEERESDEHCCARAQGFLEWLNRRPEKCIAVVTHSSFLRHLFCQFGENLGKGDRENLQRTAGNCELRSVVMCSHGTKEQVDIDSKMNDFAKVAPSTVVMKGSVEE